MKFFDELKRRNVIKATIAYIVVAWVLLQVLSIVLPNFEAPSWVLKSLTFVITIGLPIWMIFSWVYEVTPEGLKKTAKVSKDQSITAVTNNRLNIIIILMLIVAIGLLFINNPISKMFQKNIVETGLVYDNSVAVLPFDDMSEGDDNQWFCDGVTEDILTNLSKIKGLRVISRTSINQYKNTVKTIPEIAKELGVSYVLEGSVRKQQNNVLITAQLIKATDDHLWADKYNEKLDDIFTIQNDVSRKIVQQLKIVLNPEEEKSLAKYPTDNIEAYQLYLKARATADSRTKAGLLKSIELCKQAIDLDANYADAYAEIAYLYTLMSSYGYINIDTEKENVFAFTKKAMSIDPNTERIYSTLGRWYLKNQDFEMARENLEKAIAINPNDVTVHLVLAEYFRQNAVFDIENTLYHAKEAQKLDPLSLPINRNLIETLILSGKPLEAEVHLNKMNFLISSRQQTRINGKILSLKNRDWTELIRYYEEALSNDPNADYIHSLLAYAYSHVNHDYEKSLYHYKKAYNINPNRLYFYSLLYNKKYVEARAILNDSPWIEFSSKKYNNWYWMDYYYYKNELDSALIYLERLDIDEDYYFNRACIYAKKGDFETTYEAINKILDPSLKAIVFAIMEEKDSMYYYMNKIPSFNSILFVNSVIEMNPYRNEPRFKEFLKKNYLPIIE